MNVKCLHLLLCGMLSVGFMGCDAPPNAQKRAAETLVFNVDATRLEPAITDTMLNITMAAPKEWKKIDDAVLAQVMEQVTPRLEQGLKLVPRWIFMNVRSRAMCIVSQVNSVEIALDDTLLEAQENAYRDAFPEATVRRATFRKDAFRIHQLMVSAPDVVLIKLICDAPETLIFEVDYVVPKAVYAAELRAIESSIGSIHVRTDSP